MKENIKISSFAKKQLIAAAKSSNMSIDEFIINKCNTLSAVNFKANKISRIGKCNTLRK